MQTVSTRNKSKVKRLLNKLESNLNNMVSDIQYGNLAEIKIAELENEIIKRKILDLVD